MGALKKSKNSKEQDERDKRARFAKVRVMLADRDPRAASLVARILFSFGFRNIEVATNGEHALAMLRNKSFELIITEYDMAPVNGLELVKAIRTAKDDKRIRRDIPIIMLTAQAGLEDIHAARDAGITEFVVKPFAAKAISDRVILIIDNPRAFIESEGFTGPCRRRRGEPPPGVADRRGAKKPAPGEVIIQSPPNFTIAAQLGDARASDILTDAVVQEAQGELMKAESEFVSWARDDIASLEREYAALAGNAGNVSAMNNLLAAAYAIKSQAGTFGYDLGTEVASMLVDYLRAHPTPRESDLLIARKHIDTITVIFNQKIKENGQEIALDLIESLKKLMQKLG